MKLEAGKRYVNRSGSVTTDPLAIYCSDLDALKDFVFFCSRTHDTWKINGAYRADGKTSSLDLTSEYIEPADSADDILTRASMIDFDVFKKHSAALSRRDQFAMAAMQGILSNHNMMDILAAESTKHKKDIDLVIALISVLHADMLIAELDKEKEE